MKTLLLTLIILMIIILLTKWLMIKKNEAIINKFLNTDDVEDFECGYGQDSSLKKQINENNSKTN